jgi:hypothetical protein
MPMSTSRVPEGVPLLSRGKHRNSRKGACFMELVSFMSGESWSDHPACTHPLLASLPRLVNDHTSDVGRHHLASLIPSVIGLTSDDPYVDVVIALRSASTALPIASEERQRALAVGVIVAKRLADALGHRPTGGVEDRSRRALAQTPNAARWAERFVADSSTTVARFRKYSAPTVVRLAVEGIACACTPDPDAVLHDLLRATIDDCARVIRCDSGDEARLADAERWAAACHLTGAVRPG